MNDLGDKMDTSEEYIKMCDCGEVQEEWKPKDGDWANSERHGSAAVFPAAIILGTLLGRFKADHTWLPRQDQIQEMFTQWNLGIIHNRFDLRIGEICWQNYDGNYVARYKESIIFTSFEQLWLAFYMYEKHNKIWNGEKWDKLK